MTPWLNRCDIVQDKPITLIHNKPRLLSSIYPDKFRIDMERRLTERQIHLVLNDSISTIPSETPFQLTTENGVRIDADLAVGAL